MPRVLAIVSEDLGRGFALTGVDVEPVADTAGFRAALDAAVSGGTCGMIVVEAELMEQLSAEARQSYAALTVPLVIEVPGAIRWREEQALPFDDYVARLVRRAVGYQLNIKL